MGGKKKKQPKKEKKPKDTNSITAVDRTFYEITITDLNNKLARLRAHNARVEEVNEELAEKLRKLEEDKVDITAHLNRQLAEKIDLIKEMDERLTELAKVRESENCEWNRKLTELNAKFKTMNDQLTSEIKLLNGKLNSLEEFRVQRDDFLVKFDEQETALKEAQRMHKEVLYKVEQEALIERNRLKMDVERKLRQLSEDFTSTNEIRIADYVKQLIKENIAMKDEMGEMARKQIFYKDELDRVAKRKRDVEMELDVSEKILKDMIKKHEKHVMIIERLTDECEKLKYINRRIQHYKVAYENTLKRNICEEFKYTEVNKKFRIIGQRLGMVKDDKNKLLQLNHKLVVEIIRLRTIIDQIQGAVLGAVSKDRAICDVTADSETIKAERKSLLSEIADVLRNYDASRDKALPLEDIAGQRRKPLAYKPGAVGLTPKKTLLELFKREARKIACAEFMAPESKALTTSDQIVPLPRSLSRENVFDAAISLSDTFDESEDPYPVEEVGKKPPEETGKMDESKEPQSDDEGDEEDDDEDAIQFIY